MRREPVAVFVREETGIRLGRPVVVQEHLRRAGWVRPLRRSVLTDSAVDRLRDAGVDLVRIRRWGRTWEVRLPNLDPRDGPMHARATFVSVWEAVARA